MHYSVAMNVEDVLIVVAKGSRYRVGEIVYAALLEFTDAIQKEYTQALWSISLFALR